MKALEIKKAFHLIEELEFLQNLENFKNRKTRVYPDIDSEKKLGLVELSGIYSCRALIEGAKQKLTAMGVEL